MSGSIVMSSNDFRKDLCFNFRNNKGKRIYITKRNKVIAEILFYSEKNIRNLELKMAKMMVDADINRKKFKLQKIT